MENFLKAVLQALGKGYSVNFAQYKYAKAIEVQVSDGYCHLIELVAIEDILNSKADIFSIRLDRMIARLAEGGAGNPG